MLKKFHQDLGRLGIRARRQHDLRRTFISLCLGDGGRSDILRWVTHSRPRTATIDDYTTLVWNPLCEEVAKLRITLRRNGDAAISAIANVANSGAPTDDLATCLATGSEFESDFALLKLRGGRDLKVPRPAGQDRTGPDSDGQGAENCGVAAAEIGLERTGADPECQSVSGLPAQDRRSVAPCYCNGMSTLHARVKGGQIVVEGKTDLPEGTELTLVMVESDDEMTPEERADLDAEIERGRAAIAAGRGISGDELLARVRET
jgi:hypothetical protein